jgi:hypothetical protein
MNEIPLHNKWCTCTCGTKFSHVRCYYSPKVKKKSSRTLARSAGPGVNEVTQQGMDTSLLSSSSVHCPVKHVKSNIWRDKSPFSNFPLTLQSHRQSSPSLWLQDRVKLRHPSHSACSAHSHGSLLVDGMYSRHYHKTC